MWGISSLTESINLTHALKHDKTSFSRAEMLVIFFNPSFHVLIPFKCVDIAAIFYRGADKSLARPTSRCILFDDENISFDASLVIYINSTNIPPIMIINRIYEHQNLNVAVACFLPGRAKDLSATL